LAATNGAIFADDAQRAVALENVGGTLGPTSQPVNSVFDLVGHNDQYHDNLLTLQNDSQAVTATIACRTEVGSPIVRDCDSTAGLRPGLLVIGPGIPQSAGRKIAGQISPTGFALSGPAETGAGMGTVKVIRQCGNAAIRVRDSIINYERGAF